MLPFKYLMSVLIILSAVNGDMEGSAVAQMWLWKLKKSDSKKWIWLWLN